MSAETQDSRVRELVMELMGSQMTANIINEAWEQMRPELKQEISEALGQSVLAMARGETEDKWGNNMMFAIAGDKLRQLAGELDDWPELAERLREAILRAVEERWTKAVNEAAADKLHQVLKRVEEEFRSRRVFG